MERTTNQDEAVRTNLRDRVILARNRLYASATFQRLVTRNPLTRKIARDRSAAVFDLVAGFVYSQVLRATVESGLLEHLRKSLCDLGQIADITGLSHEANQRLLSAAAALGLVEEVRPRCWTLGEHGAALLGNAGALEMIRHHALFYADLADPLALLRADRREPTALSRFWNYTGEESAQPHNHKSYSKLMAKSQSLVCEEILAAYDFGQHDRVLDIGGGHAAFAKALLKRHPHLQVALFDLPSVIDCSPAGNQPCPPASEVERYRGDFFKDPLPEGFDCLTLVRILHDHDDDPARTLLLAARKAIAPGGRLVIAEPMAGAPGAKRMGDAYFGMYLWAMGSGRPRTMVEIRGMLKDAGFSHSSALKTTKPITTSAIVAFA